MHPKHIDYVSLGEHRGRRRLWLEGRKLSDAGFTPATRFIAILDAAAGRIRLVRANDGDRIVSKREREGGAERPIIDIGNALLDRVLSDRRRARITYRAGEIEISIHHLDRRAQARSDKLARLRSERTARIGSVCTGAGILDAALHAGLSRAGLRPVPSFAVEIDPRYQDLMLANNPAMDGACSVLGSLDEIEPADLPAIDILAAGLPCTAASLSGRAKKGAGVPERDPDVGHLVFPFLELVKEAMPVAVVLENVVPYRHTASYLMARTVLERLGYRLEEAELDGPSFGALERRVRLCLLAVDPMVGEGILDGMERKDCAERMADVLEEVPPDDERWKDVSYLAAKEVRDLADGHNFKRQLIDPGDRSVGVIGRQYWKYRSTEPMVPHPWKPDHARLLTPREHARCKGIDPSLIDGACSTTAHEALGQSVIPAAFEAVGAALGVALLNSRMRKATPMDGLPLFAPNAA